MKEAVTTTCSTMIGVGILTLPRVIAKATDSPDGWLSILIAGSGTLIVAWLIGRLARKFHSRTFLQYTSDLTGKAVAAVVAVIYAAYFMLFSAFVIRSVAELAKQYLFERTPLEVVSLAFLLVVIYAVSGSRTGIVRLTLIFLPFVLAVTAIFLLLGINLFEVNELKPVLNSSWRSILAGSTETVFSFLGFEALLFYVALMRTPAKAPHAAVISVAIVTLAYALIYTFTIAVFSHEVTQNIIYPTIELAREVRVPGDFFERLESLFFIFWLVSIFCTAAIAMDVTVQSAGHLVKFKKQSMLYVLAPAVYLLSMVPQNIAQLANLGKLIGYIGALTALLIPGGLYVISMMRRR